MIGISFRERFKWWILFGFFITIYICLGLKLEDRCSDFFRVMEVVRLRYFGFRCIYFVFYCFLYKNLSFRRVGICLFWGLVFRVSFGYRWCLVNSLEGSNK